VRVRVCVPVRMLNKQTKRFLRADSNVLIFTLNDYSVRFRYVRTDTRVRNVLDNTCMCARTVALTHTHTHTHAQNQ